MAHNFLSGIRSIRSKLNFMKGWTGYQQAEKLDIERIESLFRFNQVIFKASHNSEERDELFPDEHIELGLCRSLELDFVVEEKSTYSKEWIFRVQHSDKPDPNCPTIDSELKKLYSWSKANPGHTVLTVHFDMKKTAAIYGDHEEFADQLDRIIQSVFPRESLFIPQDLKKNHLSLLEAVQQSGWPLLSELRGKFIFVITGGDNCPEVKERRIIYASGKDRTCFVDIDTRIGNGPKKDLDPTDISNIYYQSLKDRVFINLHLENKWYWQRLVREAHKLGYVSRGWKGNNAETWLQAVKAGVNLIATDYISGMMSRFANPSPLGFLPLSQYRDLVEPNVFMKDDLEDETPDDRLIPTEYASEAACPVKEHFFIFEPSQAILFCRHCGFFRTLDIALLDPTPVTSLSKQVPIKSEISSSPVKSEASSLMLSSSPLKSDMSSSLQFEPSSPSANPSPLEKGEQVFALISHHNTYAAVHTLSGNNNNTTKASISLKNNPTPFIIQRTTQIPSCYTICCPEFGGFLSANQDGEVFCVKKTPTVSELWTVQLHKSKCAFVSCYGYYLCAEKNGSVVANRTVKKNFEEWKVVPFSGKKN